MEIENVNIKMKSFGIEFLLCKNSS